MTAFAVLSKKPLVEAIFEIRWELAASPGIGQAVDPLYDIFIGAMLAKLRGIFPEHVRLPLAQVPGPLVPWQVQHQFRAKGGSWPLVQLGSGILTVNDTEGYASETFLPLCIEVFNALKEFWAENQSKPQIVHCQLRYIDADELEGESLVALLRKLKVSVQVDDTVSAAGGMDPSPSQVSLATQFPVKDPGGTVSLTFNRGLKREQPALIWETAFTSEAGQCAVFEGDPQLWLKRAHEVIHNVFFAMVSGDLLEKYK